jgi:hypothetical protein
MRVLFLARDPFDAYLVSMFAPPNKSPEPTAAVPAVGGHTQIHACGFSRRGSALDR